MSPETLSLFTTTFVTLFVVMDGLGVAPIYAGLVEGAPKNYARRMAWKAVLVAGLILLLFAFVGRWLLDHLGVSIGAFRAAGGALLFLIALDMVFESHAQRRKARADEVRGHEDEIGAFEDISVFPLGIPMLAGPGSIAAIMLLMNDHGGDAVAQSVVLAALGLNLVLCLAMLLAANAVIRIMGATVAATITRVLGVLLAAFAAQLLFDGVKSVFGLS